MKKSILVLLPLALVTGALTQWTTAAPSPRPDGGDSPFSTAGVSLPATNHPSVRVSLTSATTEILLGAGCQKNNAHPSGSDNGRVVSWVTRSSDVDLSSINSGGKTQVYVRRTDGKLDTVLVSESVTTTGVEGYAEMPRVSGNGHWVAFVSTSERLTVEDDAEIKDWHDVFVYHVPTGTIERLSEGTHLGVEPANDGGNAPSLGIPSISFDGRFVAFESEASDLQSFPIPCDVVTTLYQKKTGGACRAKRMKHIYLRDRGGLILDDADDVIEWLTPGISGASCVMPDGPSSAPSVSADGCLVSFESDAKNLLATPLSPTSKKQIFLRDRTTDTTLVVSHDGGGGVADKDCRRARISADGAWVVFESAATNLVAGDTNGLTDVFAYEVATGAITRVSLGAANAQLTTSSVTAEVSGNGRFIAYTRAGEVSNVYELYLVDRDVDKDGVFSGTVADTETRKLSKNSLGGDADGWSGGWPFTLTTNGQFVFFMTIAQDLAIADANCLTSSCINATYDGDDGRDIYRQRVFLPSETGVLVPAGSTGSAGSFSYP